MRPFAWIACILAVAASACSNDAQTTAPTTAAPATEIFAGRLDPKGSSFYSFTNAAAGTVSVTLASLASVTSGLPTAAAVGVGMGVPAGTDCALTSSSTLTPALTAQISSSMAASTFCVDIFDGGTLTAPVNFAIRIVHP